MEVDDPVVALEGFLGLEADDEGGFLVRGVAEAFLLAGLASLGREGSLAFLEGGLPSRSSDVLRFC